MPPAKITLNHCSELGEGQYWLLNRWNWVLIWSESVGLCGASWRNWFSTSRTTACHAQGTLCKCNSRAEYIKGHTRLEITFKYFGFRNNAPSPKSNVFDQTGGQECRTKYKIIQVHCVQGSRSGRRGTSKKTRETCPMSMPYNSFRGWQRELSWVEGSTNLPRWRT